MASSARLPTILRRPTDRLPLLSSTQSRWAGCCEGRRVIQTSPFKASGGRGARARVDLPGGAGSGLLGGPLRGPVPAAGVGSPWVEALAVALAAGDTPQPPP